MITKLEIENYKSIQKLSINPGRVNIFIGKPASGKSNIIEALALLSKRNVSIKELVRMKEYNDLIFDGDIERKLKVVTNSESFQMSYENGNYEIIYFDKTTYDDRKNYNSLLNKAQARGMDKKQIENEVQEKYKAILKYFDDSYNLRYFINVEDFSSLINSYLTENIFYYKFKLASDFNNKNTERLNAPFGNNLPQIILTRGSLKKDIADILSDYDLKLGLNPNENTIKVLKEQEGVLYEYPFVSLSDSLQRLMFYITAMHTKDSTLLFEEPEAQVFPFYNKYLGEKIALDESNQYFIATHSFPFLASILQKTKPENLRIYNTYYEDYQTKVYSIPHEKFPEIYEMESSFFLNLKQFTGQA